MGLFNRVRDISLAQINSILDKAEDPVKLLDQYLRDMEKDISEAETAVAKQISLEKRLKQQLDEAKEMAAKREEQAMRALEKENEDLARRALEDKKDHQNRAEDFEGQWRRAKSTADSLRGQLNEMKREYDKMKGKKQTLQARAEAAKAQKKINEAFSGVGSGNSRKGFEKMEEKVFELEAQAEASDELREGKTSLDAELDELGDDSIDSEMAALRAKMKAKKENA